MAQEGLSPLIVIKFESACIITEAFTHLE